jgi:mannose-6-phosphate isomerase-like protein (cupin superfamily)
MTQTTTGAAGQQPSGTAAVRRAAKTAAGEGQAFWFFGSKTIIRSPEGARPVVIEMELAPGGHAPLHIHHNIDDSFYLLSGTIAVRCGDDTFVAQAGDYVSQPKGVPHTFFVLGDQSARILQTHDGEDFLNFIKQAGIPAAGPVPPAGDQPDLNWLYQIADATGQPVTGPPMSAEEAAQILAASAAR